MSMYHVTYYVEHKTFKNDFIVMIFENYIQHIGRPRVANGCQILLAKLINVYFLYYNSAVQPNLEANSIKIQYREVRRIGYFII